jgi:hypothetical protein
VFADIINVLIDFICKYEEVIVTKDDL